MDHDGDQEAAGAVRALLLEATADGPPRTDLAARVYRQLARPARRGWRRPRPAVAGGLAALVAVALAAGLLPRGAGGPAPAGAAVLDAAAATAAGRTPPALGPGQLWYTRMEVMTVDLLPGDAPPGQQFAVRYPAPVEEWWGPAGVQRTRLRTGRPIVLDPDRAAWVAAGRPRLRAEPASELRGEQARRFMSWPGVLFPRQEWNRRAWNQAVQRLEALPTDPAALDRRLRDNWWIDRAGTPTAREWCRDPANARRCPNPAEIDLTIFQAATWLLARPITPPALRAALFRVLGGLEGIQALGPATDDKGRRGTAVAITFDGVRHELLFDPDSSLLLAEREVVVAVRPEAARFPVGTTIGSARYSTRVVDSVAATS